MFNNVLCTPSFGAVVAVTAETKLRIRCIWPPAPPIISGVHHSVPSKTPPTPTPNTLRFHLLLDSRLCSPLDPLDSPFTSIQCSPIMNPEW